MAHARSDRRGYVTVELDSRQARVRLRAIDSGTNPESGISAVATFVVKDGRIGADRES